MELGRLYYLRAKIQHKAALAPQDHEPGGVTLPFQVRLKGRRKWWRWFDLSMEKQGEFFFGGGGSIGAEGQCCFTHPIR
jgi:hypothetical protein